MAMRRRDRKAAWALAVLALAAAGCGDRGLYERYTAERMFWKAARDARRLELGQRVVPDSEIDAVSAGFHRIVERFPPAEWASSEKDGSEDARIVSRVVGEALFRRAELLASKHKPEQARAACEELLRHYPNGELAVRATYLKAHLLRGEEKIPEAASLLAALSENQPVVKADGKTPEDGVIEAPLYAARWYAAAGDTAAAVRELEAAVGFYRGVLRQHPGSYTALFTRVRLFTALASRAHWEPAIATMQEVVEDPLFIREDTEGLMGVSGRMEIAGIYALQLGRPEEGLRVLRDMTERGVPPKAAARVKLMQGQLTAVAGRREEALEILGGVLDEHAHDVESCAQAYFVRGGIYESLGRWDNALVEYRTLISKFPRTRLGLAAPLQIAARYQRVGDEQAGGAALAHAIEDYRRVIEADPSSNEALLAREYMATVYLAQQNWAEAASALGDLASETTGSPAAAQAMWREAWIYDEKLDQSEEAEKRLEQLVSAYPDTPIAEEAQKWLNTLRARREGR